MSLLGRFIVLGLIAAPAAGADAKPDPADVQFFEQKIRPVLVQHCYECHSAEAKSKKRLKAQLYLDSKAGVAKGGESGPVLAGAKPADSLLVKALRGMDVSAMPPKGRLPDAVIADFEAWVRMGAPDPRTGGDGPKGRTIDIEQGRKFWSYKIPEKPVVPAVKDPAWPAGDIDRFILAKLETAGLRPAKDAEPAVLVRRIYFDLVGLPPTPEQIDEFVKAYGAKPQAALEELVDRLLASPQFGERWGRHWLDVARFAESLTLRGFVFKEAWRYRDYVIDAFNADMPYDRFVREQIAGDLLPAASVADRRRQMTAVTFLTLGNTNLEEQDKKQLVMDVVDDQLDTLGKAFLAQTIGCARCHDHKFDPIPTRDYYAMAGILKNTRTLDHANVSKWLEMPLPIDPALDEVLKKHEAAVAALQARIKNEKAKLVTAGRVTGEKPDKAGKTVKPAGVLAIADLPGIVVDETAAKAVGQWQKSKYSGTFIGDGYSHDMNAGKGEKTLTFHPELPGPGKYEVLFAYSPGTNRAAEVPVTILSAEGEKVVHVDQQKTPPLDGRFISLGQYRFESKEQGYVIVSNEGTKGHVTADAVVFLPLDGPAAKAAKPTGEKPEPAKAESGKPGEGGPAADLKKLEAELKRLEESGPRREMVMSVREEAKIADTYIHIRGSVMNVGETAPRGLLQVAAYGPKPVMPAKESGRRELADWLAGAGNPLTARVMANRVWHWLFGVGLVRTVDNFGTTGETPSHPELLDALALQFAEGGWSVKKLVRAIVLSHTYRQGSADADNPAAPAAKAADAENRLLWKANRRRLDAECIRDGMLQIAGTLKTERGGPTFASTLGADYGYKHTDTRRSVYAPVFRNSLPEALDAFDFADTGMVTGRRNVSTVAPQALFLMNHPFVLEQARQAALRLTKESGLDEPAQVARAYRLTLGRGPTERETATARRFLGQAPKPDDWAALLQALFASMDFRYVN